MFKHNSRASHQTPVATARPRMLLALSAALMLAGTGVATASDSNRDKGHYKTINVRAHYTEPAGGVDGATCAGLVAGSPQCRFYETGRSTFTGTFYGDEHYYLNGELIRPDGTTTYQGFGQLTGGVRGCGTGTFVFDGTEGTIDWTKLDPITGTAPGYNKWHVRPGSGTGGLTGLVSGEGITTWRISVTGTAGVTPTEGEGDFTGKVTCRS